MLSDSVPPLGSQKFETIQQLNHKEYFIIDRGITLSAFMSMSSITAPFCDFYSNLTVTKTLTCSGLDSCTESRKTPKSFCAKTLISTANCLIRIICGKGSQKTTKLN